MARGKGIGKRVAGMAIGMALVAGAILPVNPWSRAAHAAQEFPGDPEHRGVVTIGDYQIFPENRPGNAVYQDNRLVFSVPGETLVQIIPLPQPGRFIYLTKDSEGTARLGALLATSEPEPRITAIGESFYHAVMVMDGVVYKKLYRIQNDLSVVDLLPSSKTADGMTLGPGGVLFYHVASAQRTDDGDTVFGLRLHLAPSDDEPTRHLAYPIMNTLPRLELDWTDANRIRYRLADGREGALSVSQFQ